MALPNGDLITTVFDPQMAYPVDKRMQVDTLNSRDSISMFIRWEGMQVYVLENSKIYILQGGRSNEYWKELGTGSGTGGTTFVGQFETDDLLPTSGRSAGDYAFVGTGEDFVQYNWDSIANEWVMAEGQTDLASEHFHIGYKTPLRRPVIFRRDPKDVIIEDSGDIIIDTGGEAANFILTGEVESIRGIVSAIEGREIHLTNRSGIDTTIIDSYASTAIENRINLGGSNYNFVNGSTISLKVEDGMWVLSTVNKVAFSDALDSVNARFNVGPDGLEVITGVFDKNTGKELSFKEYADTPPVVDGYIFIQIDSKYFVNTDFLDKKQITTAQLGISKYKTPSENRLIFKSGIDLSVALGAEYFVSDDFEIAGDVTLTHEHSGFLFNGNGRTIKRSAISDDPDERTGIFFIGANSDGYPKDVRISKITLDGNKDNIDSDRVGQAGLYIYDSTHVDSPQNIIIDGVIVKNFTGSGIMISGNGVIASNIITHDNGQHGIATNVPADNITYTNIITYNNGGQGLDVSGGNCLLDNLNSFGNVQGGMKLSVNTEKFTGDNIILENNIGRGFAMTGESPNAIIQIGKILIRNNGSRGISITEGIIRSIDNLVLINNNTLGITDSDAILSNCNIGYLYVSQEDSISEIPLRLNNSVVNQIEWKGNSFPMLISANSKIVINGGLVENNTGRFINIHNTDNDVVLLSNIIFRGENGGSVRLGNNCKGSISDCDFSDLVGERVIIDTGADISVNSCKGFNHVITHTSSALNFRTGDRNRYVIFSRVGSGNTATVLDERFEEGDQINGAVAGSSVTILAGTGVTLQYPSGTDLVVPSGAVFSIKFRSATNAIVSIIKPNSGSDENPVGYTALTADFDLTAAPTVNFKKYSVGDHDFIGSPDDTKKWFIERTRGDQHTSTNEIAYGRSGHIGVWRREFYGGSWTTWRRIDNTTLSATPTIDFPVIAAGETATLTATVTGAVEGDNVNVTGPSNLYASTCIIESSWVSDDDTVSIRVKNNGGSSVDLASEPYNIKVFK